MSFIIEPQLLSDYKKYVRIPITLYVGKKKILAKPEYKKEFRDSYYYKELPKE